MFNLALFNDLIAIIFSLSIPIVAIVMAFIMLIKKKNRETDLRLAIIEKGTDPETAKLLIEQQEKKQDHYGTHYGSLRMGCVLVGAGLGALCSGLCGVDTHDIYFWIAIGAGMGIGLLISFIIENKLKRKQEAEAQANEPQ